MPQGAVFMKLYGFSVFRSLYSCILCADVLDGSIETLFAVGLCGCEPGAAAQQSLSKSILKIDIGQFSEQYLRRRT